MKIRLNSFARTSALIYTQAIMDACAQANLRGHRSKRRCFDPRVVLLDTDDYPQLVKVPMIEYAIGWLHGCAEAHGVLVEVLWDQVVADRPADMRGHVSLHANARRKDRRAA